MINKIKLAEDIFKQLILTKWEESSLDSKERKSTAKKAFDLAQAFSDEYDKRFPSKIPWEQN